VIFLCELTVVIPQLSCLLKMAKAVSTTVELVNSVTSVSVNSLNFAMWSFTSNCFPIELVPWTDGWGRTWSQTIHMMLGLLVASILQCKLNRHDRACLESFQATRPFEPSFIEAHLAPKMICNVRSLYSRIKKHEFLEEFTISSKEVLNHLECDTAVRIWTLVDPTWQPGESNHTVKQTARS